jgi:hypothetical protein
MTDEMEMLAQLLRSQNSDNRRELLLRQLQQAQALKGQNDSFSRSGSPLSGWADVIGAAKAGAMEQSARKGLEEESARAEDPSALLAALKAMQGDQAGPPQMGPQSPMDFMAQTGQRPGGFEGALPNQQAPVQGPAPQGQGMRRLALAMSMDPRLAQQGQVLLGDIREREGNVLRQTMAEQQRTFQAGEGDKERDFTRERDKAQSAERRALVELELGSKQAMEAIKLQREQEKQAREVAGALRKELQGRPEFKDFKVVESAYAKVNALGGKANPSPADDMGLIFSYMKLLDPGSTVREGEYASAQNTTGIPGQILNMYNKAVDGHFLNPGQRSHFTQSAKDLYGTHLGEFTKLADEYRSLAERSGAAPGDVVLRDTAESKVVNGKRYVKRNGEWFEE